MQCRACFSETPSDQGPIESETWFTLHGHAVIPDRSYDRLSGLLPTAVRKNGTGS